MKKKETVLNKHYIHGIQITSYNACSVYLRVFSREYATFFTRFEHFLLQIYFVVTKDLIKSIANFVPSATVSIGSPIAKSLLAVSMLLLFSTS